MLEHPRCGIIEKDILVCEISTYEQLFAGLQQHATSTVDNRPVIVYRCVRNSNNDVLSGLTLACLNDGCED